MSTTLSEVDTDKPTETVLPASHSEDLDSAEFCRSRLAPMFLFLYRKLRCQSRWRLGRLLLNILFWFEPPMRSATARQIMRQFHGVTIGAYSYGSCFDPGTMVSGISIGRYVSFATGVRIFLQNHPLHKLSTHPLFYESSSAGAQAVDLPPGKLEIGNDVWIGCNALILPGCNRIGDGAVIGAGAVVTKDIPSFSIVGGCPAKLIRTRFPAPVIEQLEASQWWQHPIEEVERKMEDYLKIINQNEA